MQLARATHLARMKLRNRKGTAPTFQRDGNRSHSRSCDAKKKKEEVVWFSVDAFCEELAGAGTACRALLKIEGRKAPAGGQRYGVRLRVAGAARNRMLRG